MGLRLAAIPVLGPGLGPLIVRHLLPVVLQFARRTFGNMEPEEIAHAATVNRIPGTERAFQRSLAPRAAPGQGVTGLNSILRVALVRVSRSLQSRLSAPAVSSASVVVLCSALHIPVEPIGS